VLSFPKPDILLVVDAFVEDPEHPDDKKDRFVIGAATKDSVPLFGPPLPPTPVFKRNENLRKVILSKCRPLASSFPLVNA